MYAKTTSTKLASAYMEDTPGLRIFRYALMLRIKDTGLVGGPGQSTTTTLWMSPHLTLTDYRFAAVLSNRPGPQLAESERRSLRVADWADCTMHGAHPRSMALYLPLMSDRSEGRQIRTDPPAPVDGPGRRDVAISGSIPDRWTLAGADDLEPDIARILAADDDFRVLQSLANNRSVPQDVLAVLAQRPEVAEQVASNPFAPPELKEPRLLIFHPSISITRFLADVGATEDQRRMLMSRYTRAMQEQDQVQTLGEAWHQVLTSTEQP
ncbi:hypothetical protein ACIPY5_15080 [Microbacterium sp. NPDC089698]|uniref:hypothetical protein n=1 Tax=Microbacterium sp. NPDC089698 TaxID=3364200 RepID=UPI0037F765F4